MPSFFFSSRRRHTRLQGDWSSDVCSSDLTLRADDHRHAGQAPRQEERLVARLLGVEPDRRRVGDDLDATGPAAVAATDDRGPVPEVGQRLDGDLHRRRLAGAADDQVADGNDGYRERARLEDAARVEPLARAEETTVSLARGAEEPRRALREPLLPAPKAARAAVLHRWSPGTRKRLISSSVSRTAPRCDAAASYAASPSLALRPASERSRASSRPSSPASRTTTAAPAASRSAADSRKFSVCGPMSTGFRRRAGSSMLWPPKGTRLPPTKTTSATV